MKKKLGIAALVLAILLTGYSVAASLSLRGLGAYRLSTGLGRVLSLSWQYTALAAVLLWALLAAAMRLKKRRQKSKLAPAAGERPQQPAARPEKPRPARKSEKPSAKVSEKKAKIPPAKGKGASSATPDLSQQEALSGKTELICADAEKKAEAPQQQQGPRTEENSVSSGDGTVLLTVPPVSAGEKTVLLTEEKPLPDVPAPVAAETVLLMDDLEAPLLSPEETVLLTAPSFVPEEDPVSTASPERTVLSAEEQSAAEPSETAPETAASIPAVSRETPFPSGEENCGQPSSGADDGKEFSDASLTAGEQESSPQEKREASSDHQQQRPDRLPKEAEAVEKTVETGSEQEDAEAPKAREERPEPNAKGEGYCPACGAALLPGRKFCIKCGHRMGGEA